MKKLITIALVAALATPAGAVTSVTCEGLSNKECVEVEKRARAFKAKNRVIKEFLKKSLTCTVSLDDPLDFSFTICDFDENIFEGCVAGKCGFSGTIR